MAYHEFIRNKSVKTIREHINYDKIDSFRTFITTIKI